MVWRVMGYMGLDVGCKWVGSVRYTCISATTTSTYTCITTMCYTVLCTERRGGCSQGPVTLLVCADTNRALVQLQLSAACLLIHHGLFGILL